MADNGTDFIWTKDVTVVRQQDAIAVYGNPDGDLVIRRRRDWNEEDDVWIVIARDQVGTVMQAMKKVLADLEADGHDVLAAEQDDGNPPGHREATEKDFEH